MKNFFIILPSFDKNGVSINQEKLANKVGFLVSKKFGGCTMLAGAGCYILKSGQLQKEGIVKVEFVTKKTYIAKCFCKKLAGIIAKKANQECVAWGVNSSIYFEG